MESERIFTEAEIATHDLTITGVNRDIFYVNTRKGFLLHRKSSNFSIPQIPMGNFMIATVIVWIILIISGHIFIFCIAKREKIRIQRAKELRLQQSILRSRRKSMLSV